MLTQENYIARLRGAGHAFLVESYEKDPTGRPAQWFFQADRTVGSTRLARLTKIHSSVFSICFLIEGHYQRRT